MAQQKSKNATRGYGFLENYLSKKRAVMANRLILPHQRSGTILDLGCGTTPYFLMYTTFRKKYGLDPAIQEDFRMSGITIVNPKKIKGNSVPFPSKYFDVVTMLAVIEHIPADRVIPQMNEIRRVLKKRGRFILTTPSAWTHPLLSMMSRLRLVSSEEIYDHHQQYTKEEIRELLHKSGFPPAKIHIGTFELKMNIWAYADV